MAMRVGTWAPDIFLKIKLHRVDCEKQSSRGLSDAAYVATVDNRGTAINERGYKSIIGATAVIDVFFRKARPDADLK